MQFLTQLHLDGYADGAWSSIALLFKASVGRNTGLCLLVSFSPCYLFWLNCMESCLFAGVLSVVHVAEHNAFGGGSEYK